MTDQVLHDAVTDYVCAIDRRWFEDHPGAARYVRDPLDHEFCNFVPAGLCMEFRGRTRVHALAPGIRGREPIGYFRVPEDGIPSDSARVLFDLGFTVVELPEGVA